MFDLKSDDIKIISVLRNFEVGRMPSKSKIQIKPITSGLLHRTYLVRDAISGRKLVVQNLKKIFNLYSLNSNLKLYDSVYKRNINLLPNHWIGVKYLDVKSTDNKIYMDRSNNNWRVMKYVSGRVFSDISVLPSKERMSLAYSFGEGLVNFRRILDLVPLNRWKNTLPRFHDLAYHLNYLHSILEGKEVVLSLSNDPLVKFKIDRNIFGVYADRVSEILKKIDKRRVKIRGLEGLGVSVTHGDPKINNAVFSHNRGVWMCNTLIDLDTLQVGGVLDDIGDALRSIGGLGNESPEDLDSVTISSVVIDSVIEGYFNKYSYYYGFKKTRELRKYIYKSYAKFLYMLSLRFLADFLIGDKYFLVSKHQKRDLNLFKAEVQMRQLELIEKKYGI